MSYWFKKAEMKPRCTRSNCTCLIPKRKCGLTQRKIMADPRDSAVQKREPILKVLQSKQQTTWYTNAPNKALSSFDVSCC